MRVGVSERVVRLERSSNRGSRPRRKRRVLIIGLRTDNHVKGTENNNPVHFAKADLGSEGR